MSCLVEEAIEGFQHEGTLVNTEIWGNGHFNNTFLVNFEKADGSTYKMILQQMNKKVFQKPVELMENVMNVTSYLQERILQNGGDPARETLNVFPTKDGRPYYIDTAGEYWRAYRFIDGAVCYEQVSCTEEFYQSGLSFGNFQRLLAEYPAETLHETIANFHDTRARFQVFK